jgi:ribokinase
MRVAVIGHVEWVEFVSVPRLPRPGDVVHAASSFTRAAGGGGVVSAVLAELGADVDFFCALGDDAVGHAAAEQLRERGVRAHVAWREEPTRRAVTMLEDGGERTIVTIGKRLEPSGEDDLDWSRLRGADGAYVTAGDPAALARARQARVLVASPRARQALDARGAADDRGEIDALVLSASDHDEREWAHTVRGRARLLVTTEGAGGGRWWGASEGRWDAVPAPGPVVDSYGCGDSFAAGFTFALAAREPVADAAALGARCGARCLTLAGAP